MKTLTCTLSMLFAELLKRRPEGFDEPDWLYKSPNHEGSKTFRISALGRGDIAKLLPKICAKAGVRRRTAHALRCTAIWDTLKAGVSVRFSYLFCFILYIFVPMFIL